MSLVGQEPNSRILFVEVEVKLYAALRRYKPKAVGGAPHHSFRISLPAGATVATLMDQLAIPEGMVAAAARNDEAAELSDSLADGDRVTLFPPSAGG